MEYRSIFFILFFCCYTTFCNICLSQTGTPVIFQHTKSDYNASVVNWDIMPSNDGNIYVANAVGLLEYNGDTWSTFALPNGSIVRSIFYHKNRIYIGGQDEVGYFERIDGNFQYHSLRGRIAPRNLPLEDIWDIMLLDGIVYFISTDRVYAINESSSRVIYTGNPIYGLTSTENDVYFVDGKDGIYQLNGFDETLFISRDQLNNKQIVGLSGNGTKLYLYTEDSEIYESNKKGEYRAFKTDIKDFLQTNRIQDLKTNGRDWVIGTRFGGIAVLDESGSLKYIVNKEKGLQNNAINKLALDSDGNVWAASSNGIDHVLINDRKQIIHPDGDLEGSIYDIVEYQGRMYFATSNGLYVQNTNTSGVEKNNFDLIPGSEGQVWGLDISDNTLFMAHNNGAYAIQEGKAKKISPGIGAWKFVATPDQKHMYVGTYYGVDLYSKEGILWTYQKTFKYPNESSRILVSGKGNNLWVSHPYRGVYRMIIDENFDLVRSDPYYGQKGLPSNKLNYIFDVNGKVIVAAETGIYEFDMIKDQFIKSEWLSSILPQSVNIRNIQTDIEGNIWYLTANEVVKLTIVDGKVISKINYPELVGKFVGGFETLYIHDMDNIFACSDQGAIKYDISNFKTQSPIVSRLLSLSTHDTTYYTSKNVESNHVFNHQQNSITFKYSSNKARPDILYNCYLKGNDRSWSGWMTKQTKEYNNLLAGDYAFSIKSKMPDGSESEIFQYEFEIKPPWYKSRLAYALYSLLIISLLLGMLLIPNKRYQRDKALLEDEKQKTEEELEQLKIESLQNEITHQNSELASSTMHLVQKNATLNKVKSDIEGIRSGVSDMEIRKQLKKVLSSLNDDIRLDEDWKGFAIHFDKVHSDFLKRLKIQHPNLTPKDLKLAAYLRMNLATKEIAPLLNISVRGVEISRYRLRKKIGLTTNTNLSDWMLSF